MTRIGVLSITLVAACATARGPKRTDYPDGTYEEYTLVDGKRQGKTRLWHSNGRLASEGNYAAGKREGTFVYFTENGDFAYQALFLRDEEVWRSSDRDARPDVRKLTLERQETAEHTPIPTRALPVPWFVSVDRTTSLDRAGMQLGFGQAAGLPFGSAKRFDLFGTFSLGELGAYGQFSQTSLTSMEELSLDRTLSGRRTLEGGATYHLPFHRFGDYRARAGLLVPVSNDDNEGFLAASAGAFQRPADAAASVPSTVALRTSTSLVHTTKRFVLQGDGGLDWLLGGEPRPVDVLARANLGLGFGSRTAILSVELSNTVSLTDLDRRLHSVGFGGGASIAGMWLSGLLSYCVSGGTAFTTAVGYEL